MGFQCRNLGKAGVQVSDCCLGALNFGWRTEAVEAERLIHGALAAGINFFDAASCYGREQAEEFVGRALLGRRHTVVLATKTYSLDSSEPNGRGNSRYRLIPLVEGCLRRLQTEWIDLLQVHPDLSTPLEETIRTLDQLVRAGKVRYYGFSHFPAWRIAEALWLCDRLGLEAPVSEQPSYHLLSRRAEVELLPALRHFGLALLPHGPLAGGLLTGKYRLGDEAPPGSRGAANRWPLEHAVFRPALEAVEGLRELAAELGMPMAHLALAWLRQQSGVTAPVIGPRTAAQLEAYLPAWEVTLSGEIMARLDHLVPPGTTVAG